MRGRNKIRLGILFLLVISCFILIGFAYKAQFKLHEEFGPSFNLERKRIGLPVIGEFESQIHHTWDDYYPDQPIFKWIQILLNNDLPTSSYYFSSEKNNAIQHEAKTVLLESNLLFWQNEYLGEMDLFVNSTDSTRILNLTIVYLSGKDNQNFIRTNLDTTSWDMPELFNCNVKRAQEPFFKNGNITKQQTDSILKVWQLIK